MMAIRDTLCVHHSKSIIKKKTPIQWIRKDSSGRIHGHDGIMKEM